ncbi:ABC transporter ATP-binding protein [Crocinitomix catalasitica]|uniref:ABC transporter ATP-binding protein n=1 Tax=Crocinitomix catalasitica TaxID=184607 RepID=UPI0004881E1D|nr:ATP-binding cassette domain-containing protein [Crocinitomix catalasitica]
MSLLTVENISKQYAGHVALDDISISTKKGEIFGLLGPNGAGKTSLIRIINQITGPDSGRVLLEGKQITRADISKIGYLPEERGLYKKMKVKEQVLYFAQLKGLDKTTAKRKIDEWFEKFEITSWYDKKVEELSKGMAQKIQFIITVLHDPELLILDEPFSGFDPINAQLIRNEIMELKAKGTSILLSTHNMNSVEEICDSIALINKSKLVLNGELKSVKEQFKSNTYAVQFKGNMFSFGNALFAGFSLEKSEQIDENRAIAHVKLLKDHNLNDLLKTVMPAVEIEGINEVLPTMNDIFIQAVQGKEGGENE